MIRRFAVPAIVLGTFLLAAVPADAQVEFLQQNWTSEVRQFYYTTSQGSRMMPYKWFLALEAANGPGVVSARSSSDVWISFKREYRQQPRSPSRRIRCRCRRRREAAHRAELCCMSYEPHSLQGQDISN